MLHLPPGDAQWPGVLVQFAILVAKHEGRAYAAWAVDRLSRAMDKSHALIAQRNGQLVGVMLFEMLRGYAELTFPWLVDRDAALADALVDATLRCVRQERPDVRGCRVERHLLPGVSPDLSALMRAGFVCHERRRMTLSLLSWVPESLPVPGGYQLVPWNIRYLDRTADTIYRANEGTLDAVLYAPFFGDSPVQCRAGLLGILAGQYGPIHPTASLVACHGKEVAGINLILREHEHLASVVEISVDPAHQGKGLGRLLMTRSLSVLVEDQFDQVELAVTAANTRAIKLYDALGFTDVGAFMVCVL